MQPQSGRPSYSVEALRCPPCEGAVAAQDPHRLKGFQSRRCFQSILTHLSYNLARSFPSASWGVAGLQAGPPERCGSHGGLQGSCALGRSQGSSHPLVPAPRCSQVVERGPATGIEQMRSGNGQRNLERAPSEQKHARQRQKANRHSGEPTLQSPVHDVHVCGYLEPHTAVCQCLFRSSVDVHSVWAVSSNAFCLQLAPELRSGQVLKAGSQSVQGLTTFCAKAFATPPRSWVSLKQRESHCCPFARDLLAAGSQASSKSNKRELH